MSASPKPGLSSPEGLQLARQLLRPQLPHDIHDYILEGLCKAIDGVHVFSVLPTGAGKTGYFYGFILLLRALRLLSPPCPLLKKKYPAKPVMIGVFPTKGLEEEMEKKFRDLKIAALAINEDTLAAARRHHPRRNLWKECIEGVEILLLSPEQLSSQPFHALLDNPKFSTRICALGIDEVHLVQDWGDPMFREAFRSISLVHARMRSRPTMICLTATLLAGQETTNLLNTLGLKPGSFFFQRRSNIRRDVQDIYRVLRHGLSGWSFPDLDWIVEGDRKTIIYCGTFGLSFRLRVYYHYKAPAKIIRLYNSLCFPSYNADTRRLFVEDPNTQVIIATDALVVGIDFPNVEDVVDLDCKHPNHGKQCKGRAGRKGEKVRNPRGITYVTKATMDKAKKMVEKLGPVKGGNTVDQGLHIAMAHLYLASCYPAYEDILYDNPSSDSPCTCETCSKMQPSGHQAQCSCSGCNPEPALPPLPRSNQAQTSTAMYPRLTDAMLKEGNNRLKKFREELWEEICDEIGFIQPIAILPDAHIKNLLDNFNRIKTLQDLAPYVDNLYLLSTREPRLFSVILDLQVTFATLPQPPQQTRRKPGQKLVAPGDEQPETIASSSLTTVADAPTSGSAFPSSYSDFWSSFAPQQPGAPPIVSLPRPPAVPPRPAALSFSPTRQPLTCIATQSNEVLPSSEPTRLTIRIPPKASLLPSKRRLAEDVPFGIPVSPRRVRRQKLGKENER